MAFNIEGMSELVSYILKDRGQDNDRSGMITFVDEDFEQEIASAVAQFSQDVPHDTTVDVEGTGSSYYKLTGLDGWVNGFSTLQAVEYPAIDPEETNQAQEPTYLEIDHDVVRYKKDSDDYIIMQGRSPSPTEYIRLRFSSPYILTDDADDCTIPINSWNAVAYLAASRLCRRMAAFTANSSDATINAVASEFRDSNSRWIKTAEEFENQYRTHVGLPLVHNGRVQTKVASVPVERSSNWNTYPSKYGDWFNYSNRRR